jgi:excisionase family DNA binding protein
MNEDLVLRVKDVALILKLAEKTVYSMAHDGELPAFKIRGQWRIRRLDFDKWIAEKVAAAPPAKDGK